ncbi:MAG: type II toxin-antitoxin system prevent-host-death family antitoxin [Calditrichia bacterium]|jgi:prevent-host-death family protein|nr:type II toxin-antitoxin system prevent-host-death family antitoxin [Calditrichia bacterium]
MQTIPVSELRANLMNVLKTVEQGSTLDITSRGKVVAKLVPPSYSREKAINKLKEIRKRAKIHDILSPIDVKWEAN